MSGFASKIGSVASYLEDVFLRLRIVLFGQMLGDLELDKILHRLGDGEGVSLVHILLLEPGLDNLVSGHLGVVRARETKELKKDNKC